MFASYFKTAHGQRVFFFLVPFAWAVCTLAVDRQLGRRSTGSRRSFFPRTRPLSVSMFCTRRRANRFQRHLTRTRRAMPNFVRYFSKNVFSRLSIFGTELGLSARGFQWPLHGCGSAADRQAVSFRSPPPPHYCFLVFFRPFLPETAKPQKTRASVVRARRTACFACAAHTRRATDGHRFSFDSSETRRVCRHSVGFGSEPSDTHGFASPRPTSPSPRLSQRTFRPADSVGGRDGT